MKEQLTAVEYIKEKLLCDEYWYENMTFEQIFEQAKEMEQKQMADMYRKAIEKYDPMYGKNFKSE
jgi:hypothetical protein